MPGATQALLDAPPFPLATGHRSSPPVIARSLVSATRSPQRKLASPRPWATVTPTTSRSKSSSAAAAAAAAVDSADSVQLYDPSAAPSSAAAVVREFYAGINRRDLASVAPLIAEDCLYDDLVFSSPFVGRKAILEFFEKFTESISSELQFSIDDISEEDSWKVGVTWHLDWQGRPFPFSKGCSFYHLALRDGQKQIVYGRDCVEPIIKPGEMALVAVRTVTWILQRFPGLANKI